MWSQSRRRWNGNGADGFNRPPPLFNNGTMKAVIVSGVRTSFTLLNEMMRRDVELGVVTVCAAGGMGLAMVLERV